MRVGLSNCEPKKTLPNPLTCFLPDILSQQGGKELRQDKTQHLGTKRQHGALGDQDSPGAPGHDTSWVVQALWVQGGSSGCLVLSVFSLVQAPGSSTPRRLCCIVHDA